MSVALFPAGGDPAVLAAIHAGCFPDPWDSRAMSELLAMPGSFAFHTAGGFVLARVAAAEAEILTLAVLPAARRSGTGTALVAAAAVHAHRAGAQMMFLEVAAGNLPALTLYRRLGFVEAGQRKAYYTAGRARPEDALILRSNLPLSALGKSPAAG